MLIAGSSLFPQVAASQVDKYILQTGLPGCEMQKLRAMFFDCIEQRGNGQVWLAHGEADQNVVVAD